MNLNTPLKRYQQRVADGEIRADRAQFAAIRQLNSLHRALIAHQRPDWKNWRNWASCISRLFQRRWDRGQGIYLWGGVGTGKTMLMDMFYQSFPDQIATRIHFHRFMQAVHNAKNEIKDQSEPLSIIAADWAKRTQILCLDEFSVTDITDAMLLSGLLHELFSRGVSLVTTSNTHPDQLYKDGLQRQRFLPAIELLKKQTRILKVDSGSDYRIGYLQLDSLYHVPHDDKVSRALQQSYIRLEGDTGEKKNTLVVCGREVEVIAAGRGTAWFCFAALCETNRSKADYIELSKRFHTLILSEIPKLDSTLDDATRRLIELVDELYDRGVNLIVSAACEPHDLYHGTRLKEPFQRTASRLQEMRSNEYLSRPHLQ